MCKLSSCKSNSSFRNFFNLKNILIAFLIYLIGFAGKNYAMSSYFNESNLNKKQGKMAGIKKEDLWKNSQRKYNSSDKLCDDVIFIILEFCSAEAFGKLTFTNKNIMQMGEKLLTSFDLSKDLKVKFGEHLLSLTVKKIMQKQVKNKGEKISLEIVEKINDEIEKKGICRFMLVLNGKRAVAFYDKDFFHKDKKNKSFSIGINDNFGYIEKNFNTMCYSQKFLSKYSNKKFVSKDDQLYGENFVLKDDALKEFIINMFENKYAKCVCIFDLKKGGNKSFSNDEICEY